MAACGHATCDALDGEIRVGELDEVENYVVAEGSPRPNPRGVGAGGEGGFETEALARCLGPGQARKELACRGDVGQGRMRAALNLVDIEEVKAGVGDRQKLAGEGGLARAIGSGNDVRDR